MYKVVLLQFVGVLSAAGLVNERNLAAIHLHPDAITIGLIQVFTGENHVRLADADQAAIEQHDTVEA